MQLPLYLLSQSLTSRMQVDFSKSLAQSQAFRALNPGMTICLAFGRGVGKSTCQRLFWYILLAKADADLKSGAAPHKIRVRIVMLMPTLKQANRTHADNYFAELAPDGDWGFLGARLNKTTLKATFPSGSWIQWVSADNANDNRGLRCDYVSIDECDDIDPEIFYGICLPWLSEPHSKKITVFSGTPRRGRYGLLWKAYRELPANDPETCRSFHATAYDVPLLVDPKIVQRAKDITPPSTFAREWLCDFDAAEGLVYPMFSDENTKSAFANVRGQSRPIYGKWDDILIGVDHGYEDPAVFLVVGVAGRGKDAVAHVIWEYCESHKTIDELAEVASEIHTHYPTAKWYADSSNPSAIRSYEKRTGKKIKHATHKIEDGVDIVASMLSPRPDEFGGRTPQLFVDPACTHLIHEMGMYRRKRDPKNLERILDDIEDRNNHCQDSLRYSVYHYFGNTHGPRHELHDYDDS